MILVAQEVKLFIKLKSLSAWQGMYVLICFYYEIPLVHVLLGDVTKHFHSCVICFHSMSFAIFFTLSFWFSHAPSLVCSRSWFLYSFNTYSYHLYLYTTPVKSSGTFLFFHEQILCSYILTTLPPPFNIGLFSVFNLLIVAFISLDIVSYIGIFPSPLHPHAWY